MARRKGFTGRGGEKGGWFSRQFSISSSPSLPVQFLFRVATNLGSVALHELARQPEQRLALVQGGVSEDELEQMAKDAPEHGARRELELLHEHRAVDREVARRERGPRVEDLL